MILGNDFGNLPNQVASTDNVTVVDQRTNPRRDTKSAGNTRHVSFKNEDETPAKTRAQVDPKIKVELVYSRFWTILLPDVTLFRFRQQITTQDAQSALLWQDKFLM